MSEPEKKADVSWMEDERLKHIDAEKLVFLQKLVFEMQQLSDKEKLPFLMALATSSRKQDLSFTKEEADTVIAVLRENSTEGELAKINRLMSFFHN